MKRWLKAVVAMIALIAMLMENTYSVYATMDGYTSPEENAEMQVIEVNTEEESAPEVEVSVADDIPIEVEAVAEEENIEETQDTGIEDTGALLASEDIDESVEVEEFEEIEEQEEQVEAYLEYDEIHGKLIGEGLNDLRIAIDASEVPDDTYYVLHIETDAQVEYEGYALENNELEAIPNSVSEINLSNLEYLPFELYILGENDDTIGAEYIIESVMNGVIHMNINMEGSNVSEDEEDDDEPEEEYVFVTVTPSLVDEFGDAIDYEEAEPELEYDEDGILVLDDIENPPFENFEIDLGAGKIVKYSYKEAKINGTVVLGLRQSMVVIENDEENIDESEEEISDVSSEEGFIYDYTTDGENWENLTEDTVLELVYSDGKKTTYEYEDNDIRVTATLQHANAIPDDAELYVTRITPETPGYNYDAYMQAANENAELIDPDYEGGEEDRFTEDNSMLYDIAFMCEDEDGNLVEFQPADGMVKIVVDFKSNQLADDISAAESDDVLLAHLPLADDVKEVVDSTVDATDISSSDVVVEPINAQTSADGEELSFSVSDFSVFFVAASKMNPGPDRTFASVLGSAINYGVTAEKLELQSHMDSNFATKLVTNTSRDVTVGKYTNHKGGNFIIADITNSEYVRVTGDNETAARIKTTNSLANGGVLKKNNSSVFEICDKQDLINEVDSMINYVKNQSNTINSECSVTSSVPFYNLSSVLSGKTLDIRGRGEGTFYIKADGNDLSDITIKKQENQTIIFNYSGTSVTLKRYKIENYAANDKNRLLLSENSEKSDSTVEPIARTLIFNMPNATSVNFAEGVLGTFLAPNAKVTFNSTSTGWIVCKEMINRGEWHCVYSEMPPFDEPDPFSLQLYAKKMVDGRTPNSNEKFKFELLYNEDWAGAKVIQTIENNGESVQFDKIELSNIKLYSKEKYTYEFIIREVKTDGDGYTHDEAEYVVHLRFGLDKNNKYYIAKTLIYTDTDGDGKNDDWISASLDDIVFNNYKIPDPVEFEIDVKKLIEGSDGWPKDVTFDFELSPFDGGGNTDGVSVAPMPEGSIGSGANAVKTITLSEANPEGSFGKIFISPDYEGTNMWYQDPDTGEWYKYVIYMYTLKEVVPKDENKPVGVTYADPSIRYIKVFVNMYKRPYGIKYVLNERVSVDNKVCDGHSGAYEFTNKYYPASLVVKKQVTDKNNNKVATDDDFYVAVYSKNSNGSKVYYGTDGKQYGVPYVETIKADGELTYLPLPTNTQFYVEETDASGNPVESGREFEYSVSYDGLNKNKNTVTLYDNAMKKTVTIKNTTLDKGTVTLTKKGGSSSDAVNLDGVTFHLKENDGKFDGAGTRVYVTKESDGTYKYSESGSTLQDIVTDENGKITVTDLPIGNYYLVESSLPEKYEDGFVKYYGTIEFSVNTDGTTTLISNDPEYVTGTTNGIELSLTMFNKRVPAAILVEKSLIDSEGGSVDSKFNREGYKFYLYDTTNEKLLKDTVTTDKAGKASFAGMLEYGHTYVIEEDADVAASNGTILNSITPSSFIIDESWYTKSAAVSVETISNVSYVAKKEIVNNTPVTGKIRLIKTDKDGVAINDGSAKFVLSTSNNINDESDYLTVSGSNGTYSYELNSTNTELITVNGELTVDKLAPGTYFFFEKESPDENRYTFVSGTPYSFTINAKGASSSVIELVSDDDAVKVPNDSFNAKLSFNKVNAYDISKKLSSGTEFTLYETSTLGGAIVGNAILSANAVNGKVSVPFAKAAYYVLEETQTENGYESKYDGSNLKIYFTVSADQVGKTDLKLSDVGAYTNQGDLVDLENNLVKNKPSHGKVTLTKQFVNAKGEKTDKYIGEAKFKLYTNSDEYKASTTKYDQYVGKADKFIPYVDKNGTEEFSTTNQSLTIEDLPWGRYYFVETETVKNNGVDVYTIDNEEYYFTIGENKNGSLVLEASKFVTLEGKEVTLVNNTIKTGSVKITKQDLDTEEGIYGIKFDLYTADNVYVNTYTTSNDGTITVTDLEFGAYYFKEKAAAEQDVKGYTFDSDTKYNFMITGEAEPTCKLTYVLNGETKTINDGVITNAPIKGNVTLEKWAVTLGTAKSDNPEYLERIEGAEFKLYSSNPSNFGQQILSVFSSDDKYYVYRGDGDGTYTTDSEGKISVHDLPWGNYYFIETEAPAGYVSVNKIPEADRTFSFSITEEKLDVYIGKGETGKVALNERYFGSLKLTKKDSETEKGIPGVKFDLWESAKPYTSKLTSANTTNLDGSYLVTDENGEIIVHDLPWGTYTFKEAEIPEGYTATTTESNSLTINSENVSAATTYNYDENFSNEATLYNTPIKGELYLEKINEYNTALTGASFDLVRIINKDATDATYKKVNVSGSDGNYEYVSLDNSDYRDGLSIGDKIAAFVSGIFSGNAEKGSLELSVSSNLLVKNLPYGDYVIYEKTSPEGYEPVGTDNDNKIVRSFKIDGTKENGYDAKVTFTNSKVQAGVQFIKTANDKPVNNVKFRLEVFDGSDYVAFDGGAAVATAQKDHYYAIGDANNTDLGEYDGVVSFADLPVGRYRIYEFSSSENGQEAVNTYPYYDVNGNLIWSSPIDNVTKYYEFVITLSNAGMKNVGLKDYDANEYDSKTIQTIKNAERRGRAELKKTETDGTTPIEGAKFALYEGDTDKNGNPVLGDPSKDTCKAQGIEANEYGLVKTEMLPWGEYYLVETDTKDRTYFLEGEADRAQYHFTIGMNADGSFNEVVDTFTVLKKGENSTTSSIAKNEKFYGQAEFEKRDSVTNNKIDAAGIEFELYYRASENGEYKLLPEYSGDNALKAEGGVVSTKKNLEAGWYYFVETKTAKGYNLPENEVKYFFEIKQGETVDDFEIVWTNMEKDGNVYYITNEPKLGSIELYKCYVLDGTEYPLNGAEFTLQVKGTMGWSNVDGIEPQTSDKDGIVKFDNLPWGTYRVVETKAPVGYEDNKLTLPEKVINADKQHHTYEDDATLKAENTRKLGKLSITKVDNKGGKVAGVKFELQMKQGENWIQIKNPETEDGYFVTGEGGLLSVFKVKDKKGEITVDGLEWGWYRFVEKDVPEGYLMSETPYPSAEGTYVGAENKTDESLIKYTLDNFVNNKVYGNIAIKKIDDAEKGLEGAEFELFQASADGNNKQAKKVYVKKASDGLYSYISMDEATAAADSAATLVLVSPADGKIKVTGLPCGTYYMQETQAPNPGVDGNNETIIYQKRTDLVGPFVVKEDQNSDEPELPYNFQNVVNDSGKFKAQAIFYKTDANTADPSGLNGVEYTVTNLTTNETRTVSSRKIGELNGVVKIDFYAIGKYSIKETSTPDDAYELDPHTYDITILSSDNIVGLSEEEAESRLIKLSDRITPPADGTSKFNKGNNTFTNDEAKGGVKLVKKESESNGNSSNTINGGLNGVNFKLYKIGNNDSKSLVTKDGVDTFVTSTVSDEKGVISISGLDWGSYVFVETVPEGYEGYGEANGKEYTFTINEKTFKKDQKIEVVTAVNERIPGSLSLQKFFENEEDDFNGEGVAFTLNLVEGTSDITDSFTKTEYTEKDADGNYFVNFSALPWGIYELTEGETKEGYISNNGVLKTVKIGNAINSSSYTDKLDATGIDISLVGDPDNGGEGILNKKIKGSVKFEKINSVTNAPMSDVQFKIYKSNGTYPEIGKATTDGSSPIVIEGVTDANGVIVTKNGIVDLPDKSLEYGKYYLEENVPKGYEGYADGNFTYTGVNFEIKSETKVELTKSKNAAIKNTPSLGSVSLKKVDNHGNPLSGVEFTLYVTELQGDGVNLELMFNSLLATFSKDKEPGIAYKTYTTNSEGEIAIDNLPWGTYYFKESVPEGYALSEEEKSRIETPFVIGEKDGNVSLTYSLGDVENDEIPGSVSLMKKGYDSISGKETGFLEGAKFNLYRLNGNVDPKPGEPSTGDVADTLVNTEGYLETSKVNGPDFGKITVKDLTWGKYYFVEIEAPEGYATPEYDGNPTILTVGSSSETNSVNLSPSTTVTNDKGYGYVQLKKEFKNFGDEKADTRVVTKNAAEELTYLTFEIYSVDSIDENGTITGSPVGVTLEDGSTASEWKVNEGTLMTDVIGPLPFGTYAFVEKSIPSGVHYERSNAIKTFVIDEHSMDKTSAIPVAFVNTDYYGWASIGKVDEDTKERIDGITFDVYEVNDVEGGTNLVSIGSKVASAETVSGTATVKDLPLGKYAFVENKESAEAKGYLASDTIYVFEITESLFQGGTATRPGLNVANKNEDGSYTVTDDTIMDVPNGRISGSIQLVKKNEKKEALSGAKFNLYKQVGTIDEIPGAGDDVKIAGQSNNTEFVTDENGETEVISGLEWGWYYFVEIDSPEGYQINTSKDPKQISGTNATQIVKVEMEDDILEIDIDKIDINGGKELSGARFAITSAEGTETLVTWTSNGTPKRIKIGIDDGNEGTFRGLKAGTIYALKELAPPSGYTPVEDTYFSVSADNKVTLYADALGSEYKGVSAAVDKSNNINKILVKDAKTEIQISKRELGTETYLPGASLKIYDAENYAKYKADAACEYVDAWTVPAINGDCHTISGLNVSETYYLVETDVPAGYYKAEDVAFAVTADNKVELKNDTTAGVLNDRLLVMYDQPILVSIAKRATTGTDNLDGAKLSILDENKNEVISFTTGSKPALLVPEQDENEASGKYSNTKYADYDIIYGVKLEDGKRYIIHEVDSPNGYKIAGDISFTVKMADSAYDKAIGIYSKTMLDEPISLYVSKLDLTGEKELPGAKLAIYEVDENTRTKVASWISGETPHLVSIDTNTTEDGTLISGHEYVLVEEFAPVGYAVADEVQFRVNASGTITSSDQYTDDSNVKFPLIKMKDEPLALTVAKVDYRETKLAGAILELRDKAGTVYARWTTIDDAPIAFVSEIGECAKSGYQNVKINSGCHLVEGEVYYVYELEAPAGYKKATSPVEVKATKYSESIKTENLYKVYNSQSTSIGGSKTWKITPDLEKQLDEARSYITINLYSYYLDSEGNKCYVKANGELLSASEDKKAAIIDHKDLKPSVSNMGYMFDNLDKLYRSKSGEVYELKYDLEEDLNGLDELLVSKKFEENGNINFVNTQKYIDIEGSKEWIMLKDEFGNLINPASPELIEAISKLGGDAKCAYTDVDIILGVKTEAGVKPLDANGDGKADYYFTIKHGDTNSKDATIDASKKETDHVEIEWSNPDIGFEFKKLPMYDDDGNKIDYVFIEKPSKSELEGSYWFEIGTDGKMYGTDGDTITNIPIVDPISIRGEKTWKDPYDASVKDRPSVALQLYRTLAGGPKEKVGSAIQLTADNNYHFEFNNLPEYALSSDVKKTDLGKKYIYTLEEVGSIGNYDVTIVIKDEMSRLDNGDRVKSATVENKIKPEYIEISGTKTWNNEYNSVHPTVTFNLYATDSTRKDELVTRYVMRNGTGSTYSFTNLPKYDENGKLITYRVAEDKTNLGGYKSDPANGYTVVPSTERGAIKYTGNDFVNTPSLVRVAKIAGDTKRDLAGASLRVVDKDGKVVDSWTTSASVHYIEGLTFGETYTLEETEAPYGYLKADSVKFTVNADSIKSGNVVNVTMEDPKGTGSVRLTKRDAETRETLSGATFNLYTGDGSLVHVTGSSGTYTCSEDLAATTTLSVSTAGALTVDGLPFGSYYFRETSAPRGYRVSTSTEGFTLYEGGSTAEVTFLNTRLLGSAYLRKTASDGRSTLAGAVFELYSATPRTAGQAAASTIYSDAYYRYGTYTTGADGMLYVRDLPWDDYYFIEVAAPAGYVTNTDVNGDPLVYTFTVDSASSDSVVGISMGTITNDEEGGGGGGGDTTVVTGGGGGGGGVAGVRRKGGVLSDVLGVRAKPTSGVLGARVGPVTGDIANIALWLLLLIASISIIVVISIQNHKKKKDLKN